MLLPLLINLDMFGPYVPPVITSGGAYPIKRNRQRTNNFLTPEEMISTRIREDDNELITIINQVMKNIYN